MSPNQIILRIDAKTKKCVKFSNMSDAISTLAKEHGISPANAQPYLSFAINDKDLDPNVIWMKIHVDVLEFLPNIIERACLKRFFQTFDWPSVPMKRLKQLKAELNKKGTQ